MKTQYTLALTLLTGVAIGAVAVQGLHAQAKLKAYSIGEIVPIAGATISPSYLAAARDLSQPRRPNKICLKLLK